MEPFDRESCETILEAAAAMMGPPDTWSAKQRKAWYEFEQLLTHGIPYRDEKHYGEAWYMPDSPLPVPRDCRIPLLPTVQRNCVPAPIDWREGDLAWERVHGLCMIFETPDDGTYWVEPLSSKGLASHLDPDALSIPTRDQLAVTIPGTSVRAWAFDHPFSHDRVHVWMSDAVGSLWTFPRHTACALHLNIVSADQVERHYKAGFPPEE